MDRHQDIEDPEHARALVVQRKSAREQRLLVQFLALSPRAQAYREGLEAKRVNARVHLRKILALAEIHGKEAVCRAMDDGLELACRFNPRFPSSRCTGSFMRTPAARAVATQAACDPNVVFLVNRSPTN